MANPTKISGYRNICSLRELEGKWRESSPNVLLLLCFCILAWNVLGVWVSHVIKVTYGKKHATVYCKRVLSSHAWSCHYKLKAAINALLVRLRKSRTRYPRHSRHGKLQVLTHQPSFVGDVVDAPWRTPRAWHLQRCNKLIARRGFCLVTTCDKLLSAPRLRAHRACNLTLRNKVKARRGTELVKVAVRLRTN